MLHSILFFLDEEADSRGDPCKEVEKLLGVILRNKGSDPSHYHDSEKHNLWVHCGRTKVFLTQSMVSIDMRDTDILACKFEAINR